MPSVGVPLWQPGMPAHILCQALSWQASGICVLPLPLPWAAMPQALQSWLPQPRLQVRGQASGSLSGEKCSVCSWQCFPDYNHNCNNDNASTTMNATTMTRPGWLTGCDNTNNGHDNNCDNDSATTTTTATSIMGQQWPRQRSATMTTIMTTTTLTQPQHL